MPVIRPRRFSLTLVFFIVSLGLLLLVPNDANASFIPGKPQFSPTADLLLCNGLPSTFGGPSQLRGPNPGGGCTNENTSQGANPDATFKVDIPRGHINYSTDVLVHTLSTEFTIAGDADIADGTAIGGISNTVNLGLTNNPCNNTVAPEFIWWESTTNINNVFNVAPEGTPNRFSTLATDGGDAFSGKADANSPVVTKYPNISNKLFDPDDSGDASGGFPPVKPHARYAGLTRVPPGGDWQLLQVFVFQPGVLQAFFSANTPANDTHPFTRLDPSLGWTHVVILNDPTEIEGFVNPISDYCTILSSVSMLLGAPGGTPRLKSPAAVGGIDGEGTQLVHLYTLSQRDADRDGIENDFDTCPFTPNVDNPYTSAGADGDMLDPACDPNPNVNENFGDFDKDGFQNAQDNCPLVANGVPPDKQKESEQITPRNVAAPDGGPRADSIGDACDSEQGGSDTVANGAFLFGMDIDAVCINNDPNADKDRDGWCSLVRGADPNDNNAAITGKPNQDADKDGSTNVKEKYMNTDPMAACPRVSRSHDAWPQDFNKDRSVNILDIVQLTPPVFNTKPPNPNYTERKDLNADGAINILDIVQLTPPVFNTNCFTPAIQCAVMIRGVNAADVDASSCQQRGGTVAIANPAADEVKVTVTFTGSCNPSAKKRVGVAAGIWRTEAGDQIIEGTSKCTVPPLTASVTPVPFGPAQLKSASAVGTASGDFVCIAHAKDAPAAGNILAVVTCGLLK